mmetsp:Transcript_54666/g.144448  ORF Transcript_54666/g.144448 Transcript_54666/m.144448 type:complete len:92 (-) Transcript_54666:539-814(-)
MSISHRHHTELMPAGSSDSAPAPRVWDGAGQLAATRVVTPRMPPDPAVPAAYNPSVASPVDWIRDLAAHVVDDETRNDKDRTAEEDRAGEV